MPFKSKKQKDYLRKFKPKAYAQIAKTGKYKKKKVGVKKAMKKRK